MAPLDGSNGALLIGVLVSTFFQGVLSLQTYIYYENYPEDPFFLKALVAFLWVLDFAHLIMIGQAMYYYLVTNFGNAAALAVTTITLDLHLVFLAITTFTCQAYFLRRVWRFSNRNKLLTGLLTAGCTSTLVLDLLLAGQTLAARNSSDVPTNLRIESIAVFSTGGANDLAIAFVLCWYLRRSKSEFERTNFVLTQLIQYTVSTGLLTSIFALGTLAAYIGSRETFIWLAIYVSLGRMYTNALLATLNSRRRLRRLLNAPAMGTTEIFGDALKPEVESGGTGTTAAGSVTGSTGTGAASAMEMDLGLDGPRGDLADSRGSVTRTIGSLTYQVS
ncbi:hypothetical protein FB45DRAFT_60349 [Roridomyces roridus]|uniref:L27 domain-containing protein n=1 Tax=Roridomyces roridus TaxID=1738132 RepID=A0AAD7BQE3_9AGAR|nr:hypothetical protein FB45DRAFT_60349 [Roridomyces roridus]